MKISYKLNFYMNSEVSLEFQQRLGVRLNTILGAIRQIDSHQ